MVIGFLMAPHVEKGGSNNMEKTQSSIDSFDLFLRNGWQYDGIKTTSDSYEAYYYYMDIIIGYTTTVTAEFIKDWKGLPISSSFGVVSLTATYEYKEDILYEEVENILAALDHAETNLLNNGIPFVKDYKFHGKYKKQKALKNQRIRKRMHLEEIEAEARIIREKEEEKTRQKIKAKENTNGSI